MLDCNGNVEGTTDNSYVTDNALSISPTPNIETGNTFSARNGCGCSVARFKANDTFNWLEFSFVNTALEPAMMAMMLGSNTIVDGSDVVGLAFQGSLECDECEPSVALEFWTKHIVGSGQDATHPWVHWVFPKTVWQLSDNTFEEDIAQPTLSGFSRTTIGVISMRMPKRLLGRLRPPDFFFFGPATANIYCGHEFTPFPNLPVQRRLAPHDP